MSTARKKTNRVTLQDYAQAYCTRVDGSDGYRYSFRWCINAFEKSLGHSPAYIDEVTVAAINKLVAESKGRLSSHTIRSRRNILFRLAKKASRDESLEVRPPKPVRDDLDQVKRRMVLPQAWTPAQVAHLVQTVRVRKGVYRLGRHQIDGVTGPEGTPWVTAAAYWESYLLTAWDTGLRTVDLVSLRRIDIGASGRIALVQHKTRKPIYCSVRPETLEAIDRSFELSPDRELIWPIWNTRRPWNRMRMRILQRAGLHGRMSMMRHSSGTACEVNVPGSGPQFLGNTPAVFYQSYFDRRHVQDIPQPPPLPGLEQPSSPRAEGS